ncbi:MAG: O-antigen ligase family protein, partial [Psychromonas sp.]|nr:O-antigen ligase family protein [Psychromonas sp.]
SSKESIMDLDLFKFNERQSGSNMFKQIFWILMFCFFIVRSFSEPFYARFKKEFVFCLGIGVAIGFIAFLSISWSSNPDVTFKRFAFQFIFFTAVTLSFLFSFQHNTLIKSVELAIIIVISLSFIAIFTGVGFSEHSSLVGYTSSKNVLAANLLTLIVLWILLQKVFLLDSQKSNLLLYLLFILLLLTQSKTSIFVAILYLLSIKTLCKFSKPFVTFLFVCCIGIFIFLPAISYYLNYLWHVGLYLEGEALTGRGTIWDTIYYDMFFFSKVEFGYGYGSYFGVDQIPYFFDIEYSFLQFVNSAHNGYIDLFIQLGFIGCLYLFSVLFWVGRQFNHPLLTLALIIPIVHNITESSLYRDEHIIWFFFIILVCSVSLIRYGKCKGIQ